MHVHSYALVYPLQVTGQVYIPEVNWVMMILTVVVIVIFKNTTKLGLAYGKLLQT